MNAAGEPSDFPWPYWLLRLVGAGSEQALWDAIWSVGGSPPYGGVSYAEAAEVYALLEAYRGPGMAEDGRYSAVAAHLGGRPDDVLALEVFRTHDRIASRPETIDGDDVANGLELSLRLSHTGAASYFLLLQAQLAFTAEDVATAKALTFEALQALAALCTVDPVYVEQLTKAAANGTQFAVMDGDVDAARTAARILETLGAQELIGPLAERLLR